MLTPIYSAVVGKPRWHYKRGVPFNHTTILLGVKKAWNRVVPNPGKFSVPQICFTAAIVTFTFIDNIRLQLIIKTCRH